MYQGNYHVRADVQEQAKNWVEQGDAWLGGEDGQWV